MSQDTPMEGTTETRLDSQDEVPQGPAEPARITPDASSTATGASNVDASPDNQDSAAPAVDPRPDDRLAALEAELEAERDGRLRALAELQNFRRRSQENRVQQLQFANEALLTDLLPVLDHFEMATEAAEPDEHTRAVCRGYAMILEQLRDVAFRHSLAEIQADAGAQFSPEEHEPTERVISEEACPGAIIRTIRKGYKLHGRVLRPAQVAVAVDPEDAPRQ